MAHHLTGKKVAFLVAEKGTEHAELVEPLRAVEEAGGEGVLISKRRGKVNTNNNDLEPGEEFTAALAFAEADSDDFDAVVIPGGTVGADNLRGDPDAVSFVAGFVAARKPVASICHGPWVLVEADAVAGRRLTSYPSLRTDIENAGGEWVDEEVVVDDGLVTSRRPDDLPAFSAKLVEEVAEGVHA